MLLHTLQMEDQRSSPDLFRFPVEGSGWFESPISPLYSSRSFFHSLAEGKNSRSVPKQIIHRLNQDNVLFDASKRFSEGTLPSRPPRAQIVGPTSLHQTFSSSGEEGTFAQAFSSRAARSPVNERAASGPGIEQLAMQTAGPHCSANEGGGIRVVGPDEDCGVAGCRVRAAHLEHLHCVLPRHVARSFALIRFVSSASFHHLYHLS